MRVACLAAQPGDAAPFGCTCATCQETWKPMAAASAPDPAPREAVVDIPGDASTSFSIAVGTPLDGVLEARTDHDWYAVQLVAGTRYRITLDGIVFDDYASLEDPYVYLRDSSGNLLRKDDDGGPGRNSLLNWIAPSSGLYFLDVGAWNEDYVGGYRLAISEFTMPTYSLDEVAGFLTAGYWNSGGHRWDTRDDNIITYNVTALTAEGQTLARAAFQTWANVTNLMFEEVTSGGDIPIDDNESGAFAGGTWSNGLITSMRVNVSTNWLASYGTTTDSYSFQTYVHEIGHALGLGHGGPYNGSASYGLDNLYVNDVWSYTIMSYFDQAEAGFGSYRYVMGPSLADIVAMHSIYGANTTFNSGNSVYGRNATAGSLYDFANYSTAPAFTIYDTGGTDTLDASGYGVNQTINLNAEAFSSIGGINNNISIARGVVIEGAIGGNSADSLLGNAGDNLLAGNAGNDTLAGGNGNDSLDGGANDDTLSGDAGNDSLFGDVGNDSLAGGDDADTLQGFAGADTLAGGNGHDSLDGGNDADRLDGGANDDTLSGDAGNDSLSGDGGNDSLAGGNGNDSLDGGVGDDSLIGGTGLDFADYGRAISAISVNLAAGTASGSAIGTDTLFGVEAAAGGQGADFFIGDTGDNFLSGDEGGDTLNGGAGSDSLYGGAGDDLLITDGSADYLDAGAGDDVILLGGTQLADILALFATS